MPEQLTPVTSGNAWPPLHASPRHQKPKNSVPDVLCCSRSLAAIALTERQDGCQGEQGAFRVRKGSLALTTTQGWAFRRVKRGGSAWICPGRPFLALPWAGRACPPGKHSLRYPDTPWRSQAKAGRSLSQARTHGDGKASRLGPRFEARARGQGQREAVQSEASASL